MLKVFGFIKFSRFFRGFKKHSFILFAGIFSFLVFLTLALYVVSSSSLANFDFELLNSFSGLRNAKLAEFFLFFTALAEKEVIFILGLGIIICFLLFNKKKEIIFLTLSLFAGVLFSEFFKFLIKRERPSVFYSLFSAHTISFSFPSGHAVFSVLFYGFVYYVISQFLKTRLSRILLFLFIFILALLIGFSRFYLGVHWLSDVFGGWILGFSLLFFVIFLFLISDKAQFLKERADCWGNHLSVFKNSEIKTFIFSIFIFCLFFIYVFYSSMKSGFGSQFFIKTSSIKGIYSYFSDLVLSNEFPKFFYSTGDLKLKTADVLVVAFENNIRNALEMAFWEEEGGSKNPFFKNNGDYLSFFKKSDNFYGKYLFSLWKTNFYYQDVPIWAGIVHFIPATQKNFISSDLKITKKDFIISEFSKTGEVLKVYEIQILKPFVGYDFLNRPFFNDGKVYVIHLK